MCGTPFKLLADFHHWIRHIRPLACCQEAKLHPVGMSSTNQEPLNKCAHRHTQQTQNEVYAATNQLGGIPKLQWRYKNQRLWSYKGTYTYWAAWWSWPCCCAWRTWGESPWRSAAHPAPGNCCPPGNHQQEQHQYSCTTGVSINPVLHRQLWSENIYCIMPQKTYRLG